MKVVIYHSHIVKIGGIETFIMNFVRRMWDKVELTLLYAHCDFDQVKRYSDYVDCELYEGQKVECDTLILASAWGTMVKESTAKKVIQMIHADYSVYIKDWAFKYTKHQLTTHHVAVGQNVAKQFKIATGYEIDKVIYNLISDYNPEPKKKNEKLTLITASRISREKGFARMLLMAEKMKGKDYVWNIYGDISTDYAAQIIPHFKKYPQVRFLGVTGQALELVNQADYLVQLSDTEGMPYSIQEALSVRTPVISTNYPAIFELVENGKNGYIFDMKLSDFSLDIIKKIPKLGKYKEKSTEADWLKIL